MDVTVDDRKIRHRVPPFHGLRRPCLRDVSAIAAVRQACFWGRCVSLNGKYLVGAQIGKIELSTGESAKSG
jgi:hypothetical protein